MDKINAFSFFWSGIIIFMMGASLILAIAELKSGQARMQMWFANERVSRDDEPAHSWVAAISKLLVFPIGAFMLWFASDMLWS